MSNTATTELSTAQQAITPFRQCWHFNHYAPLMWPYHFQPLRQIRPKYSPKLKGLKNSLSAFNTSANKSMIYWTKLMISTRKTMISIDCHTSSRWATKFGYICRRSALLDPTASFALFDMGHTPSPRQLLTMPSSSASHYSLICTQCSMQMAFDNIVHHCWTHLTLQNNSHQQCSTWTAWNRPQLIISWKHISRTLRHRGYNYIKLPKQANSFSEVNGSPRTTFSRSFLISWRNSMQWEPLLPGGELIQWILVATLLLYLDPHHCFFMFFSFLNCSTVYYF